jgi:hypothetical protein
MSQQWPGQKVGGAPAASPQSAPQAPAARPTLRPVLTLPDPKGDREEQRDETRLDLTLQGDRRAEEDSRFSRISTYRKEFLTEPTVRQFREVQNATRQIVDLAGKESDQPGPADIALIISFMKALDPGSVVRETEFATAENAGGVPETVRNAYNKLIKGGRLTPEIKREFAQTATQFYNSRLSGYNAFAEDYRGLVAAEGADPDAQGIRLAEPMTFGMGAQGGGGLPSAPVTAEQSAAAWGDGPKFDANGNPILPGGKGSPGFDGGVYDAQGNFLFMTGTVTDETPPQDPRDEMGFFGSIGETLTGSERSTPEIEALPDWTTMPAPGMAGFLASLGSLVTGPEETAKILAAQGLATSVRQDAKGNFILTGQDGKEYAIKPGFRMSDVPRAVGALAAFTPAGRATTATGAFAGGAATQAGIEATQAASGGSFDPDEVAIAGGGGVAGQQIGRGFNALRNARQARNAVPELSPMAAPEPAPVVPRAQPAANPQMAELDRAAGANLTQPVAPEQAGEFGEVARKALGRGKEARNAKEQLAIVAQANPEAKAAAERLGIELPVDVIADDARLLTTQGLARSQIGSGAQSEWGATVRAAIDKSDTTLREIGASRDLSQLSDDVRARLDADITVLERSASRLRQEVDDAVDVRAPVDARNLQSALGEAIEDFGGIAEAKAAFSTEERKLLAMLGDGETAKSPTYARLNQIRDQIGRAIYKNEGPWVDAPTANLKKYYGALAQDQLDHIERVGGPELADKMRGSNELFSRMFKGRETMQTVFGRQLEKDIGGLVNRAIGNASKGDAKDLRTLLAAVPKDMQGRTLLSGLMSRAERSSAGGGFSFDQYSKLYRGIRQNAPVYAEIAKTVGPQATQILQDLYVISSRMAAAEAKIVRTGASNQPILNALKSESLVARTMEAGKRIGARGVGAVAGGVAGGPVGAAVGQEVSGALIDAVATGGKRNLDQLHALISSEPFRDLVVKAGTGNGDIRAANRLAADPRFVRFGKGMGLDTVGKRRRWIMDAMNAAPAPSAALNDNALGLQFQQGARPLAAESEQRNADSNTRTPGTQ